MPALAGLTLAEVAFWFGALIFCYLCVYIAKALLGTAGGAVGWIPGIGGWLRTGIHTVEHKIVSVMSAAALSADARMGAALHETARLFDWLGREIKSHASLLYLIAQALTGTLPAGFILRAIHDLTHRAKAGEQALRGIGHDVLPRVKVIERGIGEDVLPAVRGLERELGRVEHRTIPAIRTEVGHLEHGAAHLWEWIRHHPRSLATTAFAGAVAWALARIGVSWIRCNNWRRIGREVCGTNPQLITDALGLLAAGAVIADLRALVKLAQQVEKVAAEGAQELLRV